MRRIIPELVEYIEQKQPARILSKVADKVGNNDLRVLAFTILGWMKQQVRTKKPRDLRGKKEYTWCQTFVMLLSELPELSEVFEGDGRRFDFRSEISAEERCEILKYVDDHYRPTVRSRGK